MTTRQEITAGLGAGMEAMRDKLPTKLDALVDALPLLVVLACLIWIPQSVWWITLIVVAILVALALAVTDMSHVMISFEVVLVTFFIVLARADDPMRHWYLACIAIGSGD